MKKQTLEYHSMPIVNFNVAGIDIGSKFHVVAVGDNPKTDVKEFGVSTTELFKIAAYLKEHGVEKVAMEATGSYERPLLTVLQENGFDVLITAGANTKNYRRFKSDVSDSIHIRTLHGLGLLPPIFITEDFSTKIRSLVRLRKTLIEDSASYIRRIQKTLRGINVRIDVAITDTHSVSGIKMLKAICAGEENPEVLAELAHGTCQKKPAEIAELLRGNWNNNARFEVQSCYRIFEKIQEEIGAIDKQLDTSFDEYTGTLPNQNTPKLKTRADKNSPNMNIEKYAHQIFGVNLNEIPGFGRSALLNFIAEVGEGIKNFHSAKAFSKWLGFTPNNKATGGKIISKKTLKNKSALPNTFRLVANSIGNIKNSNPLTNFFKRIAYRSSRMKAITATARKLSVIVYKMLKNKEEFQKEKLEQNVEKTKAFQIKKIKKNMAKMEISLQDLGFSTFASN